jgi:pimeloyl-ACP methyl ester carboxylesterase
MEGYRKPLQCRNWDRALWEYVFAYESLNLGDRLDEIEVPVLIITGDDDRIVPQKGSEKIAEKIGHAELVIISDTGHLPQEENSALFLDVVNTFLKSIL